MKFGVKLIDIDNIEQFTEIVATVSRLCSKGSCGKTCIIKLNKDSICFVLPEFASNQLLPDNPGRVSFWMKIDALLLFDFYIFEGKSAEKSTIMIEILPENLYHVLKSSPNVKNIKLKLANKQSICLSIEIEYCGISMKSKSRTVSHDIPVKIISSSFLAIKDFQEPNLTNSSLSIQLPCLKTLKHMIERMKAMGDFINIEATKKGDLTLKIQTDCVSVSCFFKNLPVQVQNNECNSYSLRLSIKRMSEFINGLHIKPDKIICNFVKNKYAHFLVIHNENMVLHYLISSILD